MAPEQMLVAGDPPRAHVHGTAKYLYGQHPGVVTQAELETKLATGWPPELGTATVVMIQNPATDTPDREPSPAGGAYLAAVTNALAIKHHRPKCNLFVLGKELRPYDPMDLNFQAAREKGVLFIRHPATQAPIVTINNGKLAVSVIDAATGRQLSMSPDLLVIANHT